MSLGDCLCYYQSICEDAVSNIVSSMSKEEQEDMCIYDGKYSSKGLVHREVKKVSGKVVAFFDLTLNDDGTLNAAVGCAPGDKYRGKGYANEVVQKGINWYNKNRNKYKGISWWCLKKNGASNALPKKFNFKQDRSKDKNFPEWNHYIYE